MLTDDEFLTAARMLTEKYLQERMDAGRKIGLDVDADGLVMNKTVNLRAAKANGEWIFIAEDWPEGCAAHHEDEQIAVMMVLSAIYRTLQEMYAGIRASRYPCQTLRFDLPQHVSTLLRMN
jgi:hypothetical protein